MKLHMSENTGIDIEALRKDLIDYYGAAMPIMAMFSAYKIAIVEAASPERLIEIAQQEHIDLKKYYIL